MNASYSINDLESLTGIKAHTIRIWEKRYELLSPMRTDTNIRNYSNEDLRKLLNVATLLRNGWKISHVSRLTQKEVNEELRKYFTQVDSSEEYLESARNALTIALLKYDEESFGKAFALAVLKLGFTNTIIKLIYPILQQIGLLWNTGEIIPAQEHFISNLIRQKFFSATDSLLTTSTNKEKIILFLPEGELHEIGLLMANYLVRKSGRQSIYLGQTVPLDNVAETYNTCGAKKLILYFTRHQSPESIHNYLKELSGATQCKQIFVCGNAQLLNNVTLPTGVTWLKEIKDMTSMLQL